MEALIPKKIHSFWFGGKPKPELAVKCIDTWRRVLPDYEFKEWTEHNYDIDAAWYTREAHRRGKFAFVSDYARIDVLKREGGIYLDADVEVLKPFTPLLKHGMFLGFMYDCNLGTAVIGARPEHPLVSDLFASYQHITEMELPNNDIFTRYFMDHVPGFRLNNSMQYFGDVALYPKEYFEFPILWGDGGYSMHHFMGSWWRANSWQEYVKSFAKRAGGRPGYWGLRQLMHRRMVKTTPFRERFLADR